MFLSYSITYKTISSPLVAAVASAAAVAVAAVSVAGAAVVAVMAEMVVGATAAVTNTSDLTRFGLRNLNFLKLYFHNSLEIIFRNFNNSFLTSDISLQAPFGI